MTIISELEQFQQKLVGLDLTKIAVELQNIIESAKSESTDPVAWRYKYTEDGGWAIVTKLADADTEKWVRENYPNFVIEPLFTHPPLSDETVKDAAIGKMVREKMQSGNDVPVSRCIITKEEFDAAS